jgi:hypothetical protein
LERVAAIANSRACTGMIVPLSLSFICRGILARLLFGSSISRTLQLDIISA